MKLGFFIGREGGRLWADMLYSLRSPFAATAALPSLSPVCLLATHAAKRNENATALHASGSVAVAVALATA